ncbi:branched-chain amino acid ABC transporter substrate-binding protein [Arboricoccus pini]|nr:branched-chain amino acid ABC transporter substrate-binding protein [Arboricoccus pini]
MTLAQPFAHAASPVEDPMGVIRIPKGAPVQIGAYWVISGPDTALGEDSVRGAKIAIADLGDKVLGHPVKLNVEDDQCTPEGGQTAATKLAANPNTVIVLGPACSSAATAGAPILWNAGISSIGTASTAPSLTAADRKPELAGFLRTIYSDAQSGANDGKWLYKEAGAKTIVTINDGSPYSSELARVTGESFIKEGGKVLSAEAIQPTDVDLKPLLTHIATLKPDKIYAPLFVAATAQLLRQVKETPGLENVEVIGEGAQAAGALIEATGQAIVGFKLAYPDVSPDAMGKGYPGFLEKYKKMFGEAPISGYHANAYDAAVLAVKAIEQVAKQGDDGALYIGKKALHDALFTISFEGMGGTVKCNQYGQCAQLKSAIYQYVSADPATFSIGTNPKKIWP